MSKLKFKELKKKYAFGSIWKHTPSGGEYTVIGVTQIKIPHVGWFQAISYRNKKGKTFTRFIEDFDNKFELIP